MKRRVVFGAAAGAALAIAAGAYVSSAGAAAPQSTFVLLDGTSATTADLKGRVALVEFWATSCEPCTSGMAGIAAAYDQYHARGFETVAVAMQGDQPLNVAVYSETRRLPFKVALDTSGELARAWGHAPGAPAAYLLDRRGAIVKRFAGAPDLPELRRLVEQLL